MLRNFLRKWQSDVHRTPRLQEDAALDRGACLTRADQNSF